MVGLCLGTYVLAYAGLDCRLYLVRHYHGSAIANKVARRLVIPLHREGDQAQFIQQPTTAFIRPPASPSESGC